MVGAYMDVAPEPSLATFLHDAFPEIVFFVNHHFFQSEWKDNQVDRKSVV